MTDVAPVPHVDPAAHGPRTSGAAGRIARGLAANLAGNAVTLLIQLVSVPIFLAAWGVTTYGEWLVLGAVPTYVALSDLSFSSVAGNSMVMLEAQSRRDEATALGRRLWSIVTLMTGTAVLAAIAIAYVFGGVFGTGAAIPAPEARVVLAALFLQVAVGNQYGVLDAWYRAGGRYPLGATMRQLGRLLEFGALIGAVFAGGGPGTAAIAFLIGSLVGFGVSWIVLHRAVPWSTFRPERPHRQTFRELFVPGLAYMAFPIGNALSLQGFTIVIGGVLGAAALVVFSTTRTATRAALQVMGSFGFSIWPELSRSVGGGDIGEARTIVRRAAQASLAVSMLLVAVLGMLGPTLIRSWTHGMVDPPVVLLYLLLLVMVVNSLWSTLSVVLASSNQHIRLAIVYVCGALAALAASIPLTSAFGLAGAALALLMIEIAMLAYTVPASLRLIGEPPVSFLRFVLDVPETVRACKRWWSDRAVR
ncbi:MAG: lipopolysaccharide biosynthesis protein [Chloroflexi bacterium]|nr:lipopolysaccharide biosynthesis protein [Chloroflexota bacterium]